MTMRSQGLELFLKRLMLRSCLDGEEQKALLALPGLPLDIPANSDFVHLGERVDHACLVVSGLVARFAQTASGERQIIVLHLPGDMADLHSIVAPQTSLPLQALARSMILQVPHAALLAVADAFPAVERAFWRDGVADASIISQSLLGLGRRSAAARLAHLFCEMAVRSAPAGAPRADTYLFDVSQYHYADMTGITPVHVNRTLRALRESGLVHVVDRRVRILDWPGLVALAEFDPIYLQLAPIDLRPRRRRLS